MKVASPLQCQHSSTRLRGITSGINIHHLVSRQANFIIQVMEFRAVCVSLQRNNRSVRNTLYSPWPQCHILHIVTVHHCLNLCTRGVSMHTSPKTLSKSWNHPHCCGRLIIIYYMSILQNCQITAYTHTRGETEISVIPPCVNSNLACIYCRMWENATNAHAANKLHNHRNKSPYNKAQTLLMSVTLMSLCITNMFG
jgi:hypothetical protein